MKSWVWMNRSNSNSRSFMGVNGFIIIEHCNYSKKVLVSSSQMHSNNWMALLRILSQGEMSPLMGLKGGLPLVMMEANNLTFLVRSFNAIPWEMALLIFSGWNLKPCTYRHLWLRLVPSWDIQELIYGRPQIDSLKGVFLHLHEIFFPFFFRSGFINFFENDIILI